MVLVVKNLPASAGNTRDMGLIPGSGRSPGGGNGTHSSILAWKIPWTEDPDGLQTMWLQEKSWTELMTEHTCIPDRQYPHCYISLLSFLELA